MGDVRIFAAGAKSQGKTYGAEFVQKITPWGTELYAGYRNYSLDRTGASFDDISGVLTGVRVKF